MTATTLCLLCDEQALFDLPVCPDCGVTSPPAADTLVFVKPDPVHADRIRIAKELEGLLLGRMHVEQRHLVAAGHQALIRVPGNTAGRVLSYLAGQGIPAVGRDTRRVWASVPPSFYALVSGVVVLGMAAGLTAGPLFLFTTPLFAGLMLVAVQLRLRQPAIGPGRQAPAHRNVVRSLTSLPAGTARDLLAQLVKAAQALEKGLHGSEVDQIVQLACRAAEDLSGLELGLLHTAGQPGAVRAERRCNALAGQLQRAIRALHQLRAETIGLDPTPAILAEVIEEFEAEADAYLEAKRELAGVLAL